MRYRRDDGASAGSLRELVTPPLRLDRRGVLAAWGELDDPGATVVAGVRRLHDEPPAIGRFEDAVAAIARTARAPVVALGGGVDAAAVLVAWRASGHPMPAVATLETGLAGYDEVEDALAIARAVGVDCEIVRATADALVALVDEAVIAAETPLYNLHPVHRLALARALAANHATLVTGDGADGPDLDYVPIVCALTRAAGMAIASPFFAARADKRALRDYVAAAGLGRLAARPKRARWMPPLPFAIDRARLEPLAGSIDVPVRLDTDRRRVCWWTLDCLARELAR